MFWADLGLLMPTLMRGAVVTLELTIASASLALVVSFAAGLTRLSRRRTIRAATALYVEVFRGTSNLVQIYYVFFVLPLFGISLSPFAAGVISIGLNAGAYGSEIVRGSILAVDPGQREASIALNMTPGLAMRRVILPQAFVMMLPSFGNLLIQIMKGTSLVSVITLTELTFAGNLLLQAVGHRNEVFALVLVMYFLMAYPLALLVGLLERRLARRLHLGRA